MTRGQGLAQHYYQCLLGFTLNVRTGYTARFTANGNLYYAYLKRSSRNIP